MSDEEGLNVRFLLNGAMDAASPLALFLVGQTELWDRLRRKAYTAIRQRIDLKCLVPYLDRAQTAAYVQAHLTYAGTPQPFFADSALDAGRLVGRPGTDLTRGGPRGVDRVWARPGRPDPGPGARLAVHRAVATPHRAYAFWHWRRTVPWQPFPTGVADCRRWVASLLPPVDSFPPSPRPAPGSRLGCGPFRAALAVVTTPSSSRTPEPVRFRSDKGGSYNGGPPQPRVEDRCHVYSAPRHVAVPGRRAGLVLAVCGELGALGHAGLPFVQTAARQVMAQATPVIWNHDQGSHFTSPQYTALLEAAGVQISLDGRGRVLDHIFTEHLWRSVTYKARYLKEYRSPRQARHHLIRSLTRVR